MTNPNGTPSTGHPPALDDTRQDMGRRDVEKRWSNQRAVSSAGWYVGGVIVLSGVALLGTVAMTADPNSCQYAEFVVCANPGKTLVVLLPEGLLIAGGLGAFVRTYLTWRRGGSWPVWQGAGWILFLLALIYLGFAGPVLA